MKISVPNWDEKDNGGHYTGHEDCLGVSNFWITQRNFIHFAFKEQI
jgi:hypothetical protein